MRQRLLCLLAEMSHVVFIVAFIQILCQDPTVATVDAVKILFDMIRPPKKLYL